MVGFQCAGHIIMYYVFIFIIVPGIRGNDVIIMENDGAAIVQIERSGPLNSAILIQILTVDETALGKKHIARVTLTKYYNHAQCFLF